MELDEKKIPTIFKAFCDENRVKILKLLLTGEKCACVLLDDMHLSLIHILSSGFVERKGKQLTPTKDGNNLVCILPDNLTSPKQMCIRDRLCT